MLQGGRVLRRLSSWIKSDKKMSSFIKGVNSKVALFFSPFLADMFIHDRQGVLILQRRREKIRVFKGANDEFVHA